MRMKTLYLLLFVLAAVTLSSVWIAQQASTIPVVSTPAAYQQVPAMQSRREASSRPRRTSAARARTAITVMGVVPQEEQDATVSESIVPVSRRSVRQDKTWTSHAASAADAEAGEVAAGNASAGVTVYRKYPTQEQRRDMDAHGIVMY
jgi:hypothetical protein